MKIVGSTLAILLLVAGQASGAERIKVTYALDVIPSGRHAPWFLALEKGYYAEAGLEVQLLKGTGSADTIKRVAAGGAHLGLADTANVVIARAKGARVKTAAVIYQKAPYAIFSLKRSNIRTPKDLEGKSIGETEGAGTKVLFAAFAKAAGIDAGRVRWINMDGALKTSSLLAGKVDAVAFYVLQAPVLERRAAQLGGVSVLRYVDYGLDLYSNGIVVTDAFIQEQPSLIRRFIQASVKGFHAAFEHPEEAVGALFKHQPGLQDRSLARAEIEVLKELALTEETRRYGIGYISPAKMVTTRDLMYRYFDLGAPLPAEEFYTAQFLSGQ